MVKLLVSKPRSTNESHSADTSHHDGIEMTQPAMPQMSEEVVGDLARIFKLLSDETRLRILLYLNRTGELHVRALCDLLKQSQPAVSHHLALLRVAGLLEARRDGKHNYYHLIGDGVHKILDMIFPDVPLDRRRMRFENYLLSYAPPE